MGKNARRAGLKDENLEWFACEQSTTNPIDCSFMIPMGVGESYLIGAHNPSTLTQNSLRFQVTSNVTYKVEKIGDDQTWTEVPSHKMCYSYTKDTPAASTEDSCELFVQSTVGAQQTEFFRLTVLAEDAQPREALLVDDTTISNA